MDNFVLIPLLQLTCLSRYLSFHCVLKTATNHSWSQIHKKGAYSAVCGVTVPGLVLQSAMDCKIHVYRTIL